MILPRINRAGQTFSYTYDVLNRPMTKVIPAYASTAASTVTTTYDPGPTRPELPLERWVDSSQGVPHPWAGQTARAAESRRAEHRRQRARVPVPR